MQKVIVLLAGVIITGILSFVLLSVFRPSPEDQAIEAVAAFYTYEQNGNFEKSWAMFHPYMKARYAKARYLQDRAGVFASHFEVDTFSFSTGEAVKQENWKPDDDAETIEVVYQVPVRMHYAGKYGNVTVVQNAFAAEMGDQWMILWNYKQ
ncbi:hypothetical protein GCM10028778_06680 [Barrientosiimonas marina]|uniref:DUF4878 domain-containing protein n=1 Tax=Lentibacillus kimchii TaxID=1542911 RepID=A0ABW2UYR9_9BACI